MKKYSIFNFLFIVSVGPKFGLGHLKRMLSVAKSIKLKNKKNKISFYLIGCNKFDLNYFSAPFYYDYTVIPDLTKIVINYNDWNAVLFDLHEDHVKDNLYLIVDKMNKNKIITIAIDKLAYKKNIFFNLRWIPSFFYSMKGDYNTEINFGWNCYLLDKLFPTSPLPTENKLLVLTGGSDNMNLGKTLPTLFSKRLRKKIEIHWVKGLYANSPTLPENNFHDFFIYNSPDYIDHLINNSTLVLSLYGVSVFEALMYKRHCFIYNKNNIHAEELSQIKKFNTITVVENHKELLEKLNDFFYKRDFFDAKINNFTPNIDGLGSNRLVNKIYNFLSINLYG